MFRWGGGRHQPLVRLPATCLSADLAVVLDCQERYSADEALHHDFFASNQHYVIDEDEPESDIAPTTVESFNFHHGGHALLTVDELRRLLYNEVPSNWVGWEGSLPGWGG